MKYPLAVRDVHWESGTISPPGCTRNLAEYGRLFLPPRDVIHWHDRYRQQNTGTFILNIPGMRRTAPSTARSSRSSTGIIG